MVRSLHEWYGFPISQACELVELPRSSHYYRSQKSDDSQLLTDMENVLGQFVTYGTRRVRSQLRRRPYSYRINRKRVQRLMRQNGWLRPLKRRKKRTTNSQHPYRRHPNLVKTLEIKRPEQVWVCDITFIRLGAGFVYLAIVMDVYTRT